LFLLFAHSVVDTGSNLPLLSLTLVANLGHLDFFQKFVEIFASEGAPPVSMTLAANLLQVSLTPVARDNGGTCKYLRKFLIKFEITLILFRGLGGR
jgi:hypothetical protein